MERARLHEQQLGAEVTDVSTPDETRDAGLQDHPGFDVRSRRLLPACAHMERLIEVKGRAGIGAMELTENEWAQACTLRGSYWVYAVFNCAGPTPELHRVRDPFGTLIASPRSGVILDERQIIAAAKTAL